ncbi:MAG: peptidoglycan editing factor PgeF [Defluviitaleaceae bacterium]|nr:peptidoglycan editing factor PgeF [Defluviitaleaceae bacterium]
MTLINDKNHLQYFAASFHSPLLTAIFATRNGGVSGQTPETEHLRSLNFSLNNDSNENVAENYRIITSSQGFGTADVIGVRQIHSDKIVTISCETRHQPREEADALVTNLKGVLLSVHTADCVPILLYDSRNSAIAAIHAGWRGTFAQIGTKTVQRMTELYGTNPADIHAAIGPAIGLCCYEVGDDLHEQFRKQHGAGIDSFFTTGEGGKPHCNLKAMNEAFLISAGIPQNNIEVSELCTQCHPDLFYSHRRSGTKRGTLASFIGLQA